MNKTLLGLACASEKAAGIEDYVKSIYRLEQGMAYFFSLGEIRTDNQNLALLQLMEEIEAIHASKSIQEKATYYRFKHGTKEALKAAAQGEFGPNGLQLIQRIAEQQHAIHQAQTNSTQELMEGINHLLEKQDELRDQLGECLSNVRDQIMRDSWDDHEKTRTTIKAEHEDTRTAVITGDQQIIELLNKWKTASAWVRDAQMAAQAEREKAIHAQQVAQEAQKKWIHAQTQLNVMGVLLENTRAELEMERREAKAAIAKSGKRCFFLSIGLGVALVILGITLTVAFTSDKADPKKDAPLRSTKPL